MYRAKASSVAESERAIVFLPVSLRLRYMSLFFGNLRLPRYLPEKEIGRLKTLRHDCRFALAPTSFHGANDRNVNS